jgi:5-methylcytosine-specific restriction endonuclease McrA
VVSHQTKSQKALEKIQKEVAAFENFERLPSARRERIPESVRLFVWQRDGGRCVKCELKERLEFDHIIPVAEGGSSTERNVQLLCETCNRKKGKAV